jgi:hypothetical protein
MKGLKIILWITAICCLLGFVLAALPWKAVAALCGLAGIQAPSALPITVLIYRVCCAAFGAIGIFFVILARNPLNYGGMLLLGAYGLVGYGIVSLIGGMRYGLPSWAYSGDVVFGFVAGTLLLVFRKKAMQ